MQKGKSVPPNYVDKYRMAEETFLYQIVFDPRTQKQVHLTPLPEDVDSADLKFVGRYPNTLFFIHVLMSKGL